MTQAPTNTYSIVITGVINSGKTTFVDALSEINMAQTFPNPKTIAMDFGTIPVDDKKFHFFGTPNGRRFDFMWDILGKDLLGLIVMVDSTAPHTFREVRSIIKAFSAYAPVPYVIAANKQDLPDAWDTDAIRIALYTPKEIHIIPCNANNPSSVANVVISLCQQYLSDEVES